MMAVKSPLMPSPTANGLVSAFSPLANVPGSPRRPLSSIVARNSIVSPSHDEQSYLSAPSPNPSNTGSNETFIDPSPIAPSSNGTEFTDLDEVVERQNGIISAPTQMARRDRQPPQQPDLKIKTTTPARLLPMRSRSDEDEPPQSVIHAPAGFSDFTRKPDLSQDRSSPSPSLKSDTTIKSPLLVESSGEEGKDAAGPTSPPQLTTSFKPAKNWSERATPRAQTRNEVDPFEKKATAKNLEDIPEGPQDTEVNQDDGEDELEAIQKTIGQFKDTEEETKALRTALAECWTLCNTLASLSYIHRERLFNFAGKGDLQEHAWKSCWKLCQKLYDSRDDDTTSQVRPTLDLCRDFCQALFEVRVRENEAADSVLRVSFELNNHLYNTHDRSLPEAFRERTLDFYITLCHRLMKQKSRLVDETDSLLRACWSLAEMLFSLRQNKREGKDADEELLGSAVQACWELCDLFREGWTQIRPDRGTPRPSQTTFTQAFQQAKQFGFVDNEHTQRGFPETPTTIFEDTTNISPDEAPVPNILILGAATNQQSSQPLSQTQTPTPRRPQPPHNKWSSASSTLSASSHNSSLSAATTASSSHTVTSPLATMLTNATTNNHNHSNSNSNSSSSRNSNNQALGSHPEDPNLSLLKLLFVKAAQNSGFIRSGPLSLPAFAKLMPVDSFGLLSWQMTLLEHYRKAVAADEMAFRNLGPPMRAGAGHVARAVGSMIRGAGQGGDGGFGWLRDLYRLVFGFYLEDAGGRTGVAVQT